MASCLAPDSKYKFFLLTTLGWYYFLSMLKHHGSSFSALHKIVDFFVSFALWMVLYHFRFSVFSAVDSSKTLSFVGAGLTIAMITVVMFSKEGLYKSLRLSSKYHELIGIMKANTFANAGFVILLYFLADERLSRAVLLGYYIASSISFILMKYVLRNILRELRSRGYNLRHVLLIGHGNVIEQYVSNIQKFKESGLIFTGWVDSDGMAEKYNIPEVEYSGVNMVNALRPDSIVVSYHGEKSSKVNFILRDIYNDVVPVIVLPDLNYLFVGYHVDHMAGVPVLVLNQPNFSTMGVVAKRAFDIVSTGIGLLFLSPIFTALAIAVKLSSPGPIFFGQERVGLDGKRFKMWKFRSMRSGVHVSGDGVPGWTVKDDPRKTKIGSFLRATSLDELPQLWNVFIGNMSVVGPRPEQPYYVEKFRHEIPAYMLRHKMKAGITGWAQVNGWRGDTSLHKRIECDLYYIRNWSLWLDIKILFLTFWKGFINKNAY